MKFEVDGKVYEFEVGRLTGAMQTEIHDKCIAVVVEDGETKTKLLAGSMKRLNILKRIKELKVDGVVVSVNENFVDNCDADVFTNFGNSIDVYDRERKKK
jgi:hypothetical protein